MSKLGAVMYDLTPLDKQIIQFLGDQYCLSHEKIKDPQIIEIMNANPSFNEHDVKVMTTHLPEAKEWWTINDLENTNRFKRSKTHRVGRDYEDLGPIPIGSLYRCLRRLARMGYVEKRAGSKPIEYRISTRAEDGPHYRIMEILDELLDSTIQHILETSPFSDSLDNEGRIQFMKGIKEEIRWATIDTSGRILRLAASEDIAIEDWMLPPEDKDKALEEMYQWAKAYFKVSPPEKPRRDYYVDGLRGERAYRDAMKEYDMLINALADE